MYVHVHVVCACVCLCDSILVEVRGQPRVLSSSSTFCCWPVCSQVSWPTHFQELCFYLPSHSRSARTTCMTIRILGIWTRALTLHSRHLTHRGTPAQTASCAQLRPSVHQGHLSAPGSYEKVLTWTCERQQTFNYQKSGMGDRACTTKSQVSGTFYILSKSC